MATPTNQRKPTFFWQGVLILLPVALMAAFSLWAILRERNAVEQEARQRAREILQALPSDFGGKVAENLAAIAAQSSGSYQYLEQLSRWPEDALRKQMQADTNEPHTVSSALAALHSQFPELQTGQFPCVTFWLNTNGDLSHRQPQSRPPAWLSVMSAKQNQAWLALQRAAIANESISNLVALSAIFKQTQPPAPAVACAEFIQLRARLSSLTATNEMDQLLRFSMSNYAVISETGVPLHTLALAEALKQAQETGPTWQLWQELSLETFSRSALTPILLDEATRLVANDPKLSGAVEALRVSMATSQASFELGEAAKQTGKLNGNLITNLWVDALGKRWFCLLQPAERVGSISKLSSPNLSFTNISTNTAGLCFPKSLVMQNFADAFKNAKISLPDYLGISLALEGEPVPLPAPWNRMDESKSAGDIMAEENFEMSLLKGMPKIDPQPGKLGQVSIFFAGMPGHPHFLLQIHLTDRTLLYAKQRQLQFIFGALIAASALAALVGFVTARGAFRRQLQLSEMKSNFVSSVSHELRAPIASVRLMAENLEHGKVSEPANQNEYFRFIVQECQRLSSLIENILDFSRIEEGRKQYEFEPTDLVALTGQTVQLMAARATERGAHLEAALPEKIVCFEADGKALQQALVNLIDNAIKHSPKGAAVKVGLDVEADALRLWVEDQGEGIPVGEQERIFERFYRRGSELRRETQGVGIGLSIVKHIVEAHGGRIQVRSSIGHGSRFTIELPLNNH